MQQWIRSIYDLTTDIEFTRANSDSNSESGKSVIDANL